MGQKPSLKELSGILPSALRGEKAVREKEAALASSQAKSEFLANMSHEIERRSMPLWG